MNLAIRLYPEPLRSLAFGSIGGAYMGIGTSLSNPTRIFYLVNQTNALLLFSFDGVTDHLALPAGGFILLDVTANKALGGGCYIAQGVRIYVKQSGVPTSGSVYLTAFYAQDVS